MFDLLQRLGVPKIATHYAMGPAFVSMMDLSEDRRAEILKLGRIVGPARYRDPTYVATRLSVEARMRDEFLAVGGKPMRVHPHYALLGRRPRQEASGSKGKRAHVLRLDTLSLDQVSFTWGDSFMFDPRFRKVRGLDHPASGKIHRLEDLPTVLQRWQSTTSRPAYQEIELQLWFDPHPHQFEVFDLG